MPVDADVVASAFADTWEHVFPAVPGGWARREGGIVAGVTGVALPMLNGVWSERVDPDPGMVSELLDDVASAGLPYCLQLRPGASAGLRDLAAGRGMVPAESVPLMVLEGTDAFARFIEVEGLVVRELSPDEADAHAAMVATGFGLPVEQFRQFITRPVLALPGVRCYLGEVEGEPVSTGMGVRVGPFVGVFDIATLPPHRGLGYGAAVTARAVADGLAAGAQWCWLQSSAMGHGVYRRLGFQDVERWDFWVMAV